MSGLVKGNDLYHRAINECLPEHSELMEKVWSPTPWMVDAITEGREQEMWQWCYRMLGNESSPIHGKEGAWHRGNVTMNGRTWFGFANKEMLEMFENNFMANIAGKAGETHLSARH